MEIINESKVSYPVLPSRPSAKERLAGEVASRIIDYMNMNSPDTYHKAYFTVRHHGDRMKECSIFVAEGKIGEPYAYKSGSKVAEAVLDKLSGVSRIDSVTVYVSPTVVGGRFAP